MIIAGSLVLLTPLGHSERLTRVRWCCLISDWLTQSHVTEYWSLIGWCRVLAWVPSMGLWSVVRGEWSRTHVRSQHLNSTSVKPRITPAPVQQVTQAVLTSYFEGNCLKTILNKIYCILLQFKIIQAFESKSIKYLCI